MPGEQTVPSGEQAAPSQSSADMLQRFFETSEAGRRAASSLKKAASGGVRVSDGTGGFRVPSGDGKPRVQAGPGARRGDTGARLRGAVSGRRAAGCQTPVLRRGNDVRGFFRSVARLVGASRCNATDRPEISRGRGGAARPPWRNRRAEAVPRRAI